MILGRRLSGCPRVISGWRAGWAFGLRRRGEQGFHGVSGGAWVLMLKILMAGITEGCEVEPGAVEEAVEEAGTVLHPPEPVPDQRGELAEVAPGQVGQGSLEVRSHRFDPVKLVRIRREPVNGLPVRAATGSAIVRLTCVLRLSQTTTSVRHAGIHNLPPLKICSCLACVTPRRAGGQRAGGARPERAAARTRR